MKNASQPMKKKSKKQDRQGNPELPSRTSEISIAGTGLLLFLVPALSGGADFSLLASVPRMISISIPVVVSWIVALIAINALFVAAETAIDLLRPSHVKSTEKDDKKPSPLQPLLDDKVRYIAGCTLGRQTVFWWLMILSGLLGLDLAYRLSVQATLEDLWALLLGIAATTIPVAAINIVFGELVPKTFASVHPYGVARLLFRFVRVTSVLFSLPGKVIMGSANLITKRFGGRASFALMNHAEEEIKSIADTAQESGEIEAEEKELLHSVFEFSDTIAREIMTPRVDMDAMPITSDPADIIKMVQESGHSRIPLYETTDDQIVGIIHAKDLLIARLKSETPVNLRTLLRPALFVPESKNLHELLTEMRNSRSQMAIVQDEFGGTAGLVTIEDIVEELVGEIVDEYDFETPDCVNNGEGWLVAGKMNLDDLNAEIGSEFDSEEFDTIGGYVFGLFGRQPKQGEALVSSGYEFKVEETDGRRIMRLHVKEVAEPTAQEKQESVTS